MTNLSFRMSSYVSYLKRSKSKQYIHSPFLFELMNKVFSNAGENLESSFEPIEKLRNELKTNSLHFEFEDFGAGGDTKRRKKVSVAELATRSLKQKKYAIFLNRLATHLKSKSIVELGTSLGITTSYLSRVENSTISSVEADRSVNCIAMENWKRLKIKNIHSFVFDINEGLDALFDQLQKIDFLFIDANHREEAMIRYYIQAIPYLHQQSVVVFDDIHWSKNTLSAWNKVKARPEVTLSFDIFQMGVLFFNKDLSKEDFCLKY